MTKLKQLFGGLGLIATGSALYYMNPAMVQTGVAMTKAFLLSLSLSTMAAIVVGAGVAFSLYKAAKHYMKPSAQPEQHVAPLSEPAAKPAIFSELIKKRHEEIIKNKPTHDYEERMNKQIAKEIERKALKEKTLQLARNQVKGKK